MGSPFRTTYYRIFARRRVRRNKIILGMNKQEAVSQIMEIKAVLPEHLQIKLIDAVKVLANFKMISVKDDMPYNHSHLKIQCFMEMWSCSV